MATIIVIDDDPEVCDMVARVLASKGHAIAVAHDGEAGLRQCNERDFDLVILDVWLPKTNGIEVLKALRAMRPALPVIMMSGGDRAVPLEHSTALAEAYGAVTTLFKPSGVEELRAAVAEALQDAKD